MIGFAHLIFNISDPLDPSDPSYSSPLRLVPLDPNPSYPLGLLLVTKTTLSLAYSITLAIAYLWSLYKSEPTAMRKSLGSTGCARRWRGAMS
jgi:hypothetical protein